MGHRRGRVYLSGVVLSVAHALATLSSAAPSITPLVEASDPHCASLPGVDQFDVRIVAELGSLANTGIVDAQFRVDGLPANVIVVPNPAATFVLGSPSQNVAISFYPSCQRSASVLLFTITVLAYDGQPLVLRVVPYDPAPLPCPAVSLCDAKFSLVCVTGGFACVNNPDCCTVPVAPASWSQIKRLYD